MPPMPTAWKNHGKGVSVSFRSSSPSVQGFPVIGVESGAGGLGCAGYACWLMFSETLVVFPVSVLYECWHMN